MLIIALLSQEKSEMCAFEDINFLKARNLDHLPLFPLDLAAWQFNFLLRLNI